MELAKVTSKGQITIPSGIRNKLGLKPGDKVLFLEEEGVVTIRNSSLVALSSIQRAMAGEAKKHGIRSEDDVVDIVNEIRNEQ